MITAEELSSISQCGLNTLEKRVMFEVSNIDTMSKTRASNKETFLIYTLYRGFLKVEEFNVLKSRVVFELKRNGLSVARRGKIEEESDFIILKIIWG